MSRFLTVSILMLAFLAGGAARAESTAAPVQATLAVPALSCDLCTAATATGLVTFGLAYAPMVVDFVYLSATFLPAALAAAIFLGPLMIFIAVIPALALVPVIGPIWVKDATDSPEIQSALVADAAIQGASLALAAVGYWTSRQFHTPVAVAPLVVSHGSGVLAGLSF